MRWPSTSVAAVRRIPKAVPSPKSQVISKLSIPSGGCSVALNVVGSPTATARSLPAFTCISVGSALRKTLTSENAEV